MSLHIVRFDCHRESSVAYGCNQPGDMSGAYVQAADAMDVIETLAEALEDCARFIENDVEGHGGPESEQARDALEKLRSMKP